MTRPRKLTLEATDRGLQFRAEPGRRGKLAVPARWTDFRRLGCPSPDGHEFVVDGTPVHDTRPGDPRRGVVFLRVLKHAEDCVRCRVVAWHRAQLAAAAEADRRLGPAPVPDPAVWDLAEGLGVLGLPRPERGQTQAAWDRLLGVLREAADAQSAAWRSVAVPAYPGRLPDWPATVVTVVARPADDGRVIVLDRQDGPTVCEAQTVEAARDPFDDERRSRYERRLCAVPGMRLTPRDWAVVTATAARNTWAAIADMCGGVIAAVIAAAHRAARAVAEQAAEAREAAQREAVAARMPAIRAAIAAIEGRS